MSQRGPEGDLRDFLRTRRARITPEQAGLTPFPGVRRVPGLRREEVAQLAGVSVDYYVRLERGRSESVSTGVLNAVARALQLDDTERENLFALARQRRRQSRSKDVPEQVRPGLVHTLRNITEVPALLLGHRLDVLAANDLARCLYLDFDGETNIACYMFLHDAARDLYIDWPETALEIVGMLRLSSSNHPRDTRLAGLVDDLSAADKDFRRWWAEHPVFKPRYGSKRYRHPQVGELTLGFEALAPVGDTGQTLGIYPVEPGSSSERALRMLTRQT